MIDPNRVPTDKDVEKRVDEARAERNKELDDIREVVKTPAGRRFYARCLDRCKPFAESYVVGMPDCTANNEGRRMVGNWLWAELLDADPEKWFQILRERKGAMVVADITRKNKEEADA